MGDLLIYGAYGYTGELVAREAVRRGLEPVLAGRRAEALAPLAAELGVEARTAALAEPRDLAAALAGVRAVLHCAGPFVATSRPMVEACLAARVHYLDLTGEIAVFEAVFRRDAGARGARVALLPGVGFDVVPTDTLAAEVAGAVPGATHLELGFAGSGGATWSRGTLVTALEGAAGGGWERRDGRLVRVRALASTRVVDFPGLGPRRLVQIPWGDLATAHRTTGIPNVRTFGAISPRLLPWLGVARPLLALAGWRPIRSALQAIVRRRVTGPSPEQRERARMHVWGRATAPDGRVAESCVTIPEGYAFTARAAVEAARRVLAGEVAPGAWTPAQAFGASLLDSVPGVERPGMRTTA